VLDDWPPENSVGELDAPLVRTLDFGEVAAEIRLAARQLSD